MRVFLFLFLAFLFRIETFAQTSLQILGAQLVNAPVTVPIGQVWKVESVFYATDPVTAVATAGSLSESQQSIFINQQNVIVRSSSSAVAADGTPSASFWEHAFPIWIPAGTSIAPSTGVHFINILCFLVQ